MKRKNPDQSKVIQLPSDPDYVALGLGGTGMMGMLWTLAMGRSSVGVEMRGDPHLGVHWNIREDLYHQLGLIDAMMLSRYGKDGVPTRANGSLFKLAELFFSPYTAAGDIVADEIISGYTPHEHIAGTIKHVEFIDDRYVNGKPQRKVSLLPTPETPLQPDANKIRTDVASVLDGPSTFQASAEALLTLMRRYLEAVEQMDVASGVEPRVRLFTHHRVVEDKEQGFISEQEGKKRIVIEELQELDMKGKFMRIRTPGSSLIDLGVPELFVVAQGFHSSDARSLGFQQKDVAVDHGDGMGERVAQADYIAGLVEVLVDGRLRRRIASEFDANGQEYWTRQIAVGHENDPEVGWILVQVPDFMTFDPIESGLVAEGTDPESPEYYAGHQKLQLDYFIEQASLVLDLPQSIIRSSQMVYGPKMFTLVERMGDSPMLASNGVVAGDSFGNGHFMTSGGAMTGMVGHSARVLHYWQRRERGVAVDSALAELCEGIVKDTKDWLEVSQTEFSAALPINFGKENTAKLGDSSLYSKAKKFIKHNQKLRRKRHSLAPLNLSDWRRPILRPGRVWSQPLPEINKEHPILVNA
jgi:hypothetical protein